MIYPNQKAAAALPSAVISVAQISKNWDYNPKLNASEQRFGLEFPTPKDLNSRLMARQKQLSSIYRVQLEGGGRERDKREGKGRERKKLEDLGFIPVWKPFPILI